MIFVDVTKEQDDIPNPSSAQVESSASPTYPLDVDDCTPLVYKHPAQFDSHPNGISLHDAVKMFVSPTSPLIQDDLFSMDDRANCNDEAGNETVLWIVSWYSDLLVQFHLMILWVKCVNDKWNSVSRGESSHQTLEIYNTNSQTTINTRTKIVKISDNPPLVNGKNEESVNMWLYKIYELIHPKMTFVGILTCWASMLAPSCLVMFVLTHSKKKKFSFSNTLWNPINKCFFGKK